MIIFASYYLLKGNNQVEGWILYDECTNSGGEIVLPDASSAPYTISCPINKNYVAKVRDMAIEAICCK